MNIKKLILITTLFASALPAFADLGDTYPTSCRRYGGKGTVINGNWIKWNMVSNNGARAEIEEQFRANQVVAIRYFTDWNNTFLASAIWAQLQINSLRTQEWSEYYVDGSEGAAPGRYWNTTDQKIFARLRDHVRDCATGF